MLEGWRGTWDTWVWHLPAMGPQRRKSRTRHGNQNCHCLRLLFQKAAGPGHRAGSLGDSERAQRQLYPERLLRAALGAASGVLAGGDRHLPSSSCSSVRAQVQGGERGSPLAAVPCHAPSPPARERSVALLPATTDPGAEFSPAKSWHPPVGRGRAAPPCAVTKLDLFLLFAIQWRDRKAHRAFASWVWLLGSPQQQCSGTDAPKCWDGWEQSWFTTHRTKPPPWPSAAPGLCR